MAAMGFLLFFVQCRLFRYRLSPAGLLLSLLVCEISTDA